MLSLDPLSSQSGDRSCSCSAVPCFLADALRLVAPLAGLLQRQLREGGRRSEQSSARATSSTRAPLRRLGSSTASERWFESGRLNGIEYNGTTIEAIYHAEGRASLQGTTYRYEYTLRDHLGNSRVTFADLNSDNVVDESESR